ncbi:hypothetical protein [Myroides profundi]|uniref:Uncharacterized protein n=1 Tax=Myroides profundi TaxID=480520 RepID=A0AAJ4W0L2_MYRPR|nr:hypothetical protein [Myroides profundi]AJH13601.1 hypothetical protein MPR_0389 [Myroides profundi]SEP92391.1 hypothetical protein SAMN04488089_101102 [Myroides profundi]
MLTLKKKVAVQLQCYLWIALLMFTTVGCSAKKAFFEVSGLQVERPLNANKALGINQISCDVETSSVTVSSKQLKQKVKGISLSSLAYTTGVDLALFHHSKGVQLDYILNIAGTDPPKYILYQQFKLAIA